MKKIFTLFFVLIAFVIVSAYTFQIYTNWKIDSEKALIKFSASVNGQKLLGNFKGVKGDVNFDPDNITSSSFNCTIDIKTINTGIKERDEHLMAKEWFDSETAATAKFVSSTMEKKEKGYIATGVFTLKGVTKAVVIPFTYGGNKEQGIFKGEVTIQRKDYGVGDADSDFLSNDIVINIEIPVTKK